MTLPKPEFVKFRGEPQEFQNFMSYIEKHLEKTIPDDRTRLDYLIKSCEGDAKKVVATFARMKDATLAYTEAKDMLQFHFGTEYKVSSAVLKECVSGREFAENDISGLRMFTVALKDCEVTLTEYGQQSKLANTENLLSVFQRLPKVLRSEWLNMRTNK